MSSRDRLEKAKVFLQLALESNQRTQQAYDRLTEKLRIMFALSSALIPVVFGLGYFIAKETKAYWILIPIFLSLIPFLAATALGIWLQRPSGNEYVDPRVIAVKYRGKSLRFMLNKYASTWADTTDYNVLVMNQKERRIRYVIYLMLGGLGLLALSFLSLVVFVMT